MKHLTIDGKKVIAQDGATILETATLASIHIPTLCYLENCTPAASCFVCAVKVDGYENFLPACATEVLEGMVVDTCSEEVFIFRKQAIELLLSEHAGDCVASCMQGDRDPANCKIEGQAKCFRCACEKKTSCKLKQYAEQYGAVFYSYRNSINSERNVYASGLIHEPKKCILCGKCVIISNKKNSGHGLTFCNRASNIRIAAPLNGEFDKAMGASLIDCVNSCPTGALSYAQNI